MKPVERSEILGLGDYETIRDRFRARVIEEKKTRRVALGPRATAVFENHDTVLLQIQEMLRTERITREAAIRHEIETYNALIPGPSELSATVFIEIEDKAERDAFLIAARGLERQIAIVVDGERNGAIWDASRELDDRASAVLYLRFRLSDAAVAAFRKAAAGGREARGIELATDHPAYTATAALTPAILRSLAEDLEA